MNIENEKAPRREFLIWRDLAVYRGLGFASHRHNHFYIQICLPDTGEVQLRGRDGILQSYRAACIPSGTSHEMVPVNGQMTLIYLDPLTTGLGFFSDRALAPNNAAFEIEDIVPGTMKAKILNAVQTPGARVRAEILGILEHHWTRSVEHSMDVRIQKSIAQTNLDDFSLRKLANDANLSVSRFRHLFKEETGVAFLDFKLWLKVKKAVHYMAEQSDLGTAAYDGGFADQAHFSRVFRRSFGMNPSEFTKRNYPFTASFFADATAP